MNKYVVRAFDLYTKGQVQESAPRTFAQCEQIYFDYQVDYSPCTVFIVPVKVEDEK